MSDEVGVSATLAELAQLEVDRRWPSPNSGLYEGLRSGFLLGAAWASDQNAVHLAILRLNASHCANPSRIQILDDLWDQEQAEMRSAVFTSADFARWRKEALDKAEADERRGNRARLKKRGRDNGDD